MKLLKSLFAKQLVGLDIGVSGIKAVELSGPKNPRLLAYNRVPLPWDTISREGEIRRRDYVVAALKKMFENRNFGTKHVAVGAFGNAIITKKIVIPKMTSEELNHQLYWEAEQYIPFDVNEVNLDFAILGNSKSSTSQSQMMDVLLVAAKKDYIQNIRSVVEEAGLIADVIDNQAFALGNAFEFNYGYTLKEDKDSLMNVIVDFGAGSTKISVVEGDKTTFTRELRQSGIGCTQLIAERLGIALTEAEKIKTTEGESDQVFPIISEFNQNLIDEISRTLDFVTTQNMEATLQGVYICGGGSKLVGLAEAMTERLSVPVKQLNPIHNVSGSGKKMNSNAVKEISYLGSVAIGLSLRTSGDAQ